LGLAAPAFGVGNVVISQVWGGSSTGTGTSTLPKSDYVELFNRTANPISLSGWSIAVASSGTSTTYAQQNLAGTIQPYSYYLIQCFATPATTGIDLPTPDITYTTTTSNLGSTTGKVVLRDITTVIGAVGCPTFDTHLIDLVTYGTTTTTCREGAANAPAGSATGSGLAIFRTAGGCVDTDQNGADFATGVPAPHTSAFPSTGGCTLGACCNNSTGLCSTATSGGCTSTGGTYRGDGTTCPPTPACPANGACCTGTSTCSLLTTAGCTAVAGIYQGDATVCTPNPCATACCFADGTCCNMPTATCVSQGGTFGAVAVTCSAAGNCIPVPANDLCSNAIALSAGVPVIGNNFAATFTGDGPTTGCLSSVSQSSKGVWYRFTPAATSTFEFSTCGTLFDCELQVFLIPNCADSGTWSRIGCDDDLCPTGTVSFCGTTSSSLASLVSGIQLNAGVQYHVRVALHGSSATGGGNFTLVVNDQGPSATGACCYALNGACEIRTALSCTGASPVGVYQGDATVCSPIPCTGVYGACCFAGGACESRLVTACTGTNIYQGDGTTCFPNPCITGACCNNTTGACTSTLPTGCSATTSTYQGDLTVCSPSPCPPAGACCNSGACAAITQAICASPASWQGAGTVCSPNPCTQPPAPTNDECASAIALSAGVPVNGYTTGASASTIAALCTTAAPIDVYYSFTPTTTAAYRFTLTPQAASAATSLSVGAICPSFDDTLFCATATTAATNSSELALQAGVPVYVRAGVASAPGVFSLVVNATGTPIGACCAAAGACSITLSTGCTGTSVFQGDGSACETTACPAITLTTRYSCGVHVGGAASTTYTVAVGPGVGSGVVATFTLPDSFGFTSSSPVGIYASNTLTVTLGAFSGTQAIQINGVGASAGYGIIGASLTVGSGTVTLANQTYYVGPAASGPLQVMLTDMSGGPNTIQPLGATIPLSAEAFSRPFASPNGTRWICSVGTSAGRVLLAGTTNPFAYEVVAQEGVSVVDPGETVGAFDYAMGINNSGQFTFSTTTSAASNNDVILRGQVGVPGYTVIAREGGDASAAFAAGDAATFTATLNNTFAIRENGRVVFQSTVSGTIGGAAVTTSNDACIFEGDGTTLTLVAREGIDTPAGGTGTYASWGLPTSSDASKTIFVRGTSDYYAACDLNGSTTTDDVTVLSGATDLVEGGTITDLSGVIVSNLAVQLTANGDRYAYGTSTPTDWCQRNGTVIAQTDSPIFAGSSDVWDDAIYSPTFFGIAGNGVGDYVVAGTFLSTFYPRNASLVANNARMVATENDPLDLNGNGVNDDGAYIGTFRDDRFFLTDDGWLYFVARVRTNCNATPDTNGVFPDVGSALVRARIFDTGACCAGSTCSAITAAACTGPNTHFAGAGTACNAPGNPVTPCCKANFNQINGITVQDIFDFLASWFANSPQADINGGGNAVQDIFDFLASWFAGC
jgi:hypothetical protein